MNRLFSLLDDDSVALKCGYKVTIPKNGPIVFYCIFCELHVGVIIYGELFKFRVFNCRTVSVIYVMSDDKSCFFGSNTMCKVSPACSLSVKKILQAFLKNSRSTKNFCQNAEKDVEIKVWTTSVNEYLQLSKMTSDGVYGPDVETFAFCQLTGLTVFVHHTLWKYWHVYRNGNQCTRRPKVWRWKPIPTNLHSFSITSYDSSTLHRRFRSFVKKSKCSFV